MSTHNIDDDDDDMDDRRHHRVRWQDLEEEEETSHRDNDDSTTTTITVAKKKRAKKHQTTSSRLKKKKGEEEEDDDETDEEVIRTTRMTQRHDENYERKQNLFDDLGKDTNLYALNLVETPQKDRREVKLKDVVTPNSHPTCFANAAIARATVEKLTLPDSIDSVTPPSTNAVEQAHKEVGARRVVPTRPVPVKPLHKFMQENLPALALARKKHEETRIAAAQARAQAIATKTTETITKTTLLDKPSDEQPESSTAVKKGRSILASGKRASTLKTTPTVASSSSSSNKSPSTLPPLPLPPDDPAASTMDRIDMLTAMLVPYLDSAYEYHEMKTQFAERHLPAPYEMPMEHVGWCHSKAFPPFRPCAMNSRCEGLNPLQRHSDLDRFPFIQYVSPNVRSHFERTGSLLAANPGAAPGDYLELDDNGDPRPTLCLRCMTKAILYLCHVNMGEDRQGKKVYVEFKHPVGRIGGYVLL